MAKIYNRICESPKCRKHFKTTRKIKRFCTSACTDQNRRIRLGLKDKEYPKTKRTRAGMSVRNDIMGNIMAH